MSELTDLLLSATSPVVALTLIGLAIGETILARRQRRMEDRLISRMKRVEGHLIAADGGEVDEDV